MPKHRAPALPLAAPAPEQEPRIETLSTQHADPNADRTVGESVKPEKNSEDGDLAAAVRIDEKMSKESEGGYQAVGTTGSQPAAANQDAT